MFEADLTSIFIYGVAILGTILALSILWLGVMGRRLFVSSPVWFMFAQLQLLVGTFVAVDLRRREDQQWLLIVVLGILCFCVGAMIANLQTSFRPAEEVKRFTSAPATFDLNFPGVRLAVIGMALVCLAVGVIFSLAVGYNTLLWAVQQAISGGSVSSAEYATLRTDISRGTQGYVAPGYTMQFTAILLPLVLYMLYFTVRRAPRPLLIVLFLVLLAADLYFLTLMGSRGLLIAVIEYFVLLVSPLGPLPNVWPRVRKPVFIVLIVMFVFYGLSTTLMGRAAADPGELLRDLADRTVLDRGEWQLTIMRYFMQGDPVWGSEWWNSLASILPGGTKGYGFTNELHALVTNSDNTRGSIGLSVWASAWYNWSTLGLAMLALVVGNLMQRFTIAYVRGGRSLSRVVMLFIAGLQLAAFRDPYSMLLGGFVTTMLFYWMMITSKHLFAPASPAPTRVGTGLSGLELQHHSAQKGSSQPGGQHA